MIERICLNCPHSSYLYSGDGEISMHCCSMYRPNGWVAPHAMQFDDKFREGKCFTKEEFQRVVNNSISPVDLDKITTPPDWCPYILEHTIS